MHSIPPVARLASCRFHRATPHGSQRGSIDLINQPFCPYRFAAGLGFDRLGRRREVADYSSVMREIERQYQLALIFAIS
jgi:hypothetical protein